VLGADYEPLPTGSTSTPICGASARLIRRTRGRDVKTLDNLFN
jgi:hypothetical protein